MLSRIHTFALPILRSNVFLSTRSGVYNDAGPAPLLSSLAWAWRVGDDFVACPTVHMYLRMTVPSRVFSLHANEVPVWNVLRSVQINHRPGPVPVERRGLE